MIVMEVKAMNTTINQNAVYKKLPPLWMVLKILQSIKQIFFLTISLSFFSSLKFFPLSFQHVKWFILFCIIYRLISIVLTWKNFGYRLSNNCICVKNGRFIKKNRYIPFERVQGINEYTPFFHRILKLKILLLDLGTNDKEASIKLDMLTYHESENIKKQLINYGAIPYENSTELKGGDSKSNFDQYSSKKMVYEISNSEIILGSLASLKLVLFFTLMYSIHDNINRLFTIDLKIDSVFNFFISTWWLMIIGVLALFILSVGYGVFQTYLRYGNFRVSSDKNRIYINKGKLSETEFSVEINRIQAVTIHYSIFYKLTGLVKVRILNTNEDDNVEVQATDILFPFIKENIAKSLINEILPQFSVHDSMIRVPKSSIFLKLLRTSYLWISIPLLIHFYLPSFWLISIVFVTCLITSQILGGLFNAYSIKGDSLQLKKCRLGVTILITSQTKMEEYNFSQGLLQRFLQQSTFKFTSRTNSSKNIKMLDVPFDVSKKLYVSYQTETITNQKVFSPSG